jgi:fumarate hydratase class I
MNEPAYTDPYPLGPDETRYRLMTKEYVSTGTFEGEEILKVDPEGLTALSREALRDAAFLLREAHLKQVAAILEDPEASDNDRGVALAMLRNAEVAAGFILPFCQDTGTATIYAKKGQRVWTGVRDEEYLTRGVYQTYHDENLRYSQTMPLGMYQEKNSGNNLPAQVDIHATDGMKYDFLFVAKGGGSANKTFLFQETKALLNPAGLENGGTSAEACLKTVKLATTGYLDRLPTSGSDSGQAFRDLESEKRLLEAAWNTGIGAQFGGKYFALDARVVRLPRHGASCPVGLGVSCSAHRNVKAKIDRDGMWIEELERNPGRFIPEKYRKAHEHGVVKIDLGRPMPEILAELTKHPIKTRLSLTGPMVVARDIAHARIKERLDQGEDLPQYLKDHPVYYAGPAKTPEGMPSGSFGPTTAGRMDSYVELFQARGGSLVMLAKGNRSRQVTESCEEHGGFYLGSIGGPAAILAQENIKKVEVLEYPELGMEAVYRIEVEDFPAFILVDDKGNDFFAELTG